MIIGVGVVVIVCTIFVQCQRVKRGMVTITCVQCIALVTEPVTWSEGKIAVEGSNYGVAVGFYYQIMNISDCFMKNTTSCIRKK
jgi:hypothetical protein